MALATQLISRDSGWRSILRSTMKGNALWYPGLGGGGDTIFDYSGIATPNNGSIAGATWGRTRKGNYYLDFDGADDIVYTVTDKPSVQNIFDGAGGSLMCWIKPRSDGENDIGRIMDKSANGTKGWVWAIDNELAGFVKMSLSVYFDAVNGAWRTTNAIIPINIWSLVAVVYDADLTTNDPVFLLGTGGVVSTPAVTEVVTPIGTRLSDVGADLIIGNRADTARTFDGGQATHRAWSAFQLIAAQFKTIYNWEQGLFV